MTTGFIQCFDHVARLNLVFYWSNSIQQLPNQSISQENLTFYWIYPIKVRFFASKSAIYCIYPMGTCWEGPLVGDAGGRTMEWLGFCLFWFLVSNAQHSAFNSWRSVFNFRAFAPISFSLSSFPLTLTPTPHPRNHNSLQQTFHSQSTP